MTEDSLAGILTRWASPQFQALNRAGSHKRSPTHATHVAEAMAKMVATHTLPVVPMTPAEVHAVPF